MAEVTVVGSLSRDLVVKASRLPLRGETLRGTEFGMFAGGKGNNQVLAAARAGAKTSMVGRVGRDQFGDSLIDTLNQSGVDHTHVVKDADAGTGIAVIMVEEGGGNAIVIAQQANLKLSPEDVEKARGTIASSRVLLMQLEIAFDTVIAAAKVARRAGVLVALNPAPAPVDGKLPDEMLANCDLLIPNQTETEQMTGIAVTDEKSAHKAAQALLKLGPRSVLITMGELGAYVLAKSPADASGHAADGDLLIGGDPRVHGDGVMISAFQVNAIDTTAAGDAFCGALAASMASGEPIERAARWGCAAGALATTRMGAEPSLPRKDEIVALIANQAISTAKLR